MLSVNLCLSRVFSWSNRYPISISVWSFFIGFMIKYNLKDNISSLICWFRNLQKLIFYRTQILNVFQIGSLFASIWSQYATNSLQLEEIVKDNPEDLGKLFFLGIKQDKIIFGRLQPDVTSVIDFNFKDPVFELSSWNLHFLFLNNLSNKIKILIVFV